jgi:hypothetical protein
MRSLWIVCVAGALSAQPASAERAERWRAMAQDWAVAAGCEVAGAAPVRPTPWCVAGSLSDGTLYER